ncbi:MAG: elongation factor 1-beta [Candidatus Nanoarchaeia archaeon]|nr:elongation factor 1-beta [Candidatus Nanoarchaeia archaeon]MDD5239400.1 elongation factor 1-beta [Candidatus Nanoarchaeia archaeon]
MANVVVTFKLMPESPELSINDLRQKIGNTLVKFGRIYKESVEPIAFGLNAIVFSLITIEKEGGTDPIEKALREIHGIADVQVTDVTRVVDVKDI